MAMQARNLEVPSKRYCESCDTGDVDHSSWGASDLHQRQYSTLNNDDAGDFGQGWQFCMAEPNIRETIARSEFETYWDSLAVCRFERVKSLYHYA